MLSGLYGCMALICLILAPAAYEGGAFVASLVLLVFVWVFYRLSEREGGRRR